MSHRHPRHRVLVFLPVAALVFGAVTLSAQTPPRPTAVATGGVIRATADTAPTNRVTLAVEQVRALMIAHHRDVAAGTSENNMVTFILASNGDYVASGSSKSVVGGFVRATNAPDTAMTVARAGQAVAVLSPTRAVSANEPRMMTFAGVGEVDARLVQDTYFKSYEPGEVSMNAIRVRFVTLTGNVVK